MKAKSYNTPADSCAEGYAYAKAEYLGGATSLDAKVLALVASVSTEFARGYAAFWARVEQLQKMEMED